MTRRTILLLCCVAMACCGCAYRAQTVRSTAEPFTLPYLQADELDSFESAGHWTVDSVADPVQLSLSREFVTSGERSLRADHCPAGAGKFMLHWYAKLNLSEASRVSIDVYNNGPAAELAIGFQTMPSWRYYEAPRQRLATGWNRDVSFDLASKTFAADAGTYASWLADRATVSRLSLVLFTTSTKPATLHFDSLRFDRKVSDVLQGIAPTKLSATPQSLSVPKYGKFELDVSFLASFQNPFDPADVNLFATFLSPSGRSYSVSGFLYEIQTKEPLIGASWKVRFTPTETGRWLYEVGVRNRFGEAYAERQSFTCTYDEAARGFVRRSAADPTLFEFDNDEPFYPIGQNVAWSQDFEPYFNKISGYGGNLVRIWLCSWQLALDIPKEPGKFNLDEAKRVDRVIELAEQHGLYVLLCLYTHGELTFAWDKNPMNQSNGGPCAAARQFFADPEAQRYFRQRLSYIVARWGYSPAIFAWELGNEMDIAPGGGSAEGLAWAIQMLEVLRRADPYERLLTTSVSSLAGKEKLLESRALDLLTPHVYRKDGPKALADLPLQLSKYAKPYLTAEYGRGVTADVDQEDPEGSALHGALWTSFMSPAAGTPMPWWWDALVDPNNLYPHLAAIAQYARGEDRRSLHLRPFQQALRLNDADAVTVIGLMSEHALYAYFYDERLGLNPERHPGPLLPAPTEVQFEGFLDGDYLVELWDTYAGEVLKSWRAEAVDSMLRLALPASDRDFAVKVKKTGYQEPAIRQFELKEPLAQPAP